MMLLNSLRHSVMGKLILSGASWSLFLQGFSKLSVLVFTTVAARSLGVAELGLFTSVQAVGLLAASVWDAGYSQFLQREVSVEPDALDRYIGGAVKSRLLLLPAFVLVFSFGVLTLGMLARANAFGVTVIGLASLCVGMSQLFSASLQAELRFKTVATTMSVGRVITALLSLLLLLRETEHPFLTLAIMYLIGEVAVLLLQAFSVGLKSLRLFREVGAVKAMRDQRRALPYALNGFFVLVYSRLDIVLVTWFSNAHQAGLYGPASRIQDAMSFVPATLSAALTPIFGRSYATKRGIAGITKAMFAVSIISAFVVLLVILIITVSADSIIPQVLGEDYKVSAEITQIIIWSLLFSAVAQPFYSFVVALGHARLLNWAYGTSLIVSLAGHAILVPLFGAVGGASVAILRDAIGGFIGIGIAFALLKSEREKVTSHERLGAVE